MTLTHPACRPISQLIFFRNFNDGKHAVIVRPKDSTQYWITSALYAETLDKNAYQVIKSTEIRISVPGEWGLSTPVHVVGDLIIQSDPAPQMPTGPQGVKHQKISKLRIRRPRNQFIIYRQWMSAKIHACNPGVTAACICKLFIAFLSLCSADTQQPRSLRRPGRPRSPRSKHVLRL